MVMVTIPLGWGEATRPQPFYLVTTAPTSGTNSSDDKTAGHGCCVDITSEEIGSGRTWGSEGVGSGCRPGDNWLPYVN